MKRKVYFDKKEGCTEIAVTDDGVLQHFYRLDDGFLTGSIFVGKVKFVKKQVGIFVDVGLEKDGLLSYREGLKPGDMVIVQVGREQTDEKGCSLTEKLTLAGRFVVLNDVGEYKFSHKLTEEKKIDLFGAPRKENVGFIFRSSCEYVTKEEVFSECQMLTEGYEKIVASAKNVGKVTCVRRENAEDVARHFAFSDDDVCEGFAEIAEQVKGLSDRKVYVEGVELVFDKTEAMTVVDVNLHRYEKQYADVETANFRADLLAVKELARQLRLRNVGGIIMVDFISLKKRENVGKLKEELEKELKKDNVRTSVELVESIGMFAIVRKQRYAAL